MSRARFVNAARLALRAFPDWPDPGTEESLPTWVLSRLSEGAWSSAEEATLFLAASLLGIEEYQGRVHGRSGEEIRVARPIPPLAEILATSFDAKRRAHVLSALELAVTGDRGVRPAPGEEPART